MSIDETRAREELKRLVSEDMNAKTNCACFYFGQVRLDFHSGSIADAIVDPEVFARLAGLLGYVKADSEEWGVRYSDGMVHFWATREEATDHAEVASRWRDAEVVHQHVSGWEVVSDAE